MVDKLTALDVKILGWIHDILSSAFLDGTMPEISFIGNGGMLWIFVACLLLCFRRYRRAGIVLLAGLSVGHLAGNLLLKPLIARARPVWPYLAPALLAHDPTDFSFPSGHALSSFTAATILTLTDRRFGWVAIPLACLIALSRLYLYVHFPSDVLAGAALGAINGYCTHWLGGRLALKKGTSWK